MKTLKKLSLLALASITLSGSLSSCATILGGQITAHQQRKPLPGEPQRAVRVGALVADVVLFWPGAVIDFATGAIYKPQRPQPSPATPVPATAASTRK